VFGAHKRLSDQERVIPGTAQCRYILSRMNSTFRNTHNIRRKLLCQIERGLQIDPESLQIPRIHADKIEPGIQRPLQLIAIMHFTQNIEAP
jgi:hypothetical protein